MAMDQILIKDGELVHGKEKYKQFAIRSLRLTATETWGLPFPSLEIAGAQ
jgi:hypothetical protein